MGGAMSGKGRVFVDGVHLTDHPLFNIWCGMIKRCYRTYSIDYKNYGAKGITVHRRWREYTEGEHPLAAFSEDMGPRMDGHTLERVDGRRGYMPSNCIWATRTTQARNRTNTKLTMNNARQIRKMREEGLTRQTVADKFGISREHVTDICRGRYWKED